MKINRLPRRLNYAVVAVILFVATILPTINTQQASAAQIGARKLTLTSSANGNISTDAAGNAVTAGTGGNGAKAGHKFDFTTTTATNVGSIVFLYCTTPVPGTTCTPPTGMDASTLTSVAAQTVSGGNFSLDTSTTNPTGCNGGAGTVRVNCILLTRTAAAETAAAKSFTFGTGGGTNWIKNPTSEDTFFVRIQIYGTAAYSTPVDQGTVASSTAQQIDITAKVQEKLKFSVGSTYVGPGVNCGTQFSDSGALPLGDVDGVLDSSTQYDNHSWFRIATNAINGTTVYYSGDTLKSGSNDINALSSEGITTAGTEQFGLALNSAEAGFSFAGGSTGLTADADYDEGNGALGTAKFNFNTGSTTTPEPIASSSSVIICDTGSVRYVGNIGTTTPAGIYTTTITYIAVPGF